MPIRQVPNPTFVQNVMLTQVGIDEPQSCRFVFNYMVLQQAREKYDEVKDQEIAAALLNFVSDWVADDMLGEDGLPVEFNEDALRKFLAHHPPAAGEIIRAYFVALAESRLKN
jgi:hypothetical protein